MNLIIIGHILNNDSNTKFEIIHSVWFVLVSFNVDSDEFIIPDENVIRM